MAGNRPIYDPSAARFVPGDIIADNVMVTGGLCGDGSIEELGGCRKFRVCEPYKAA
jgi:sarcosine oxidase subunit alpha